MNGKETMHMRHPVPTMAEPIQRTRRMTAPLTILNSLRQL
jgi:hypothetical protein